MNNECTDTFLMAFRGRLVGVRTFAQLDSLWDAILRDADSVWYVYETARGLPVGPTVGAALSASIAGINSWLRDERCPDACGFVYADDVITPAFVKVFDPRKFSGCGLGSGPAMPDWILSKMVPVDLFAVLDMCKPPLPWWRRAFLRK